MEFLLLPLHPDTRTAAPRRHEPTPLETAQGVRLLFQAGLEPAKIANRVRYQQGKLEMKAPCGCRSAVAPHPDGNWLVELEPCHTVHFLPTHEYNAVPDQMTGIRLAHDVLEANTDVQLPSEADWETVRRARCDLCGRRRMCARWQRKITDFREARMCRPCNILSWPPLEPLLGNPDAGRLRIKLDETYAKPHWTKRLAAFRASNLAPR